MDTHQTRIVVGVDAREDNAAAVRYAEGEARRRRLPIHLVHVIHPFLATPADDMIAAAPESTLDLGHAMLEEVATAVRHDLGPGFVVTTQLVVGHTAPALVEAGADASVIVLQPEHMGAHHRHVPAHSVTSAVAAHASRPVAAVPATWGAHEPRDVVTVGVDEAGSAAQLLQAAFEEALARGATLRILHTWQYSWAYDDVVFPGKRKDELSAELADGFRAELEPLAAKYDGVPVDLAVRHGRAADALVDESTRSDLVVVGRHRTERRVTHHLGSIVRAVLRESRSPVLVVDPIDSTWT